MNEDSEERDELRKAFQISFKQGDNSDALQCWNKMKESETPPPVPVAKVVKSMQRHQMDTPVILHELKAYFERYPSDVNEGVVINVVKSLANSLDADLAKAIMDMVSPISFRAMTQTDKILTIVRSWRANIEVVYSEKWQTALKISDGAALTRFRELRFAIQNSSWNADFQRLYLPK